MAITHPVIHRHCLFLQTIFFDENAELRQLTSTATTSILGSNDFDLSEQSFKWGCKSTDHEMNIRNEILEKEKSL